MVQGNKKILIVQDKNYMVETMSGTLYFNGTLISDLFAKLPTKEMVKIIAAAKTAYDKEQGIINNKELAMILKAGQFKKNKR